MIITCSSSYKLENENTALIVIWSENFYSGLFLPPAYEVRGKVRFSLYLSVHRRREGGRGYPSQDQDRVPSSPAPPRLPLVRTRTGYPPVPPLPVPLPRLGQVPPTPVPSPQPGPGQGTTCPIPHLSQDQDRIPPTSLPCPPSQDRVPPPPAPQAGHAMDRMRHWPVRVLRFHAGGLSCFLKFHLR